jgi:hypothetical protein
MIRSFLKGLCRGLLGLPSGRPAKPARHRPAAAARPARPRTPRQHPPRCPRTRGRRPADYFP